MFFEFSLATSYFFLSLLSSSQYLLTKFLPFLYFFTSFLPRFAHSLVSLLKEGGQKYPDIIKQASVFSCITYLTLPNNAYFLLNFFRPQIFTSWSYLVRDLQKYLIRDIEGLLRYVRMRSLPVINQQLDFSFFFFLKNDWFFLFRDTLELRYYPDQHINELMSPSMSFLLRTARVDQLEIGVMMHCFSLFSFLLFTSLCMLGTVQLIILSSTLQGSRPSFLNSQIHLN